MNKEEAKRGSLIQSTTIRRRTGLHLGRNPKRRGLDEPIIYITQFVVDIVNLLLILLQEIQYHRRESIFTGAETIELPEAIPVPVSLTRGKSVFLA